MGKLFYGTQTGTSTAVAQQIQTALNELISEVQGIWTAKPDDFAGCDLLILGGSTWGDGELTDDWLDFWPLFDQIDLRGTKVALFALGDQYGYAHNFVSGMRQIYDKVKSKGATVIADRVTTECFDFSHSESIVDGFFVGLVVDEVNEPEKTAHRVEDWADQVRSGMGLLSAQARS